MMVQSQKEPNEKYLQVNKYAALVEMFCSSELSITISLKTGIARYAKFEGKGIRLYLYFITAQYVSEGSSVTTRFSCYKRQHQLYLVSSAFLSLLIPILFFMFTLLFSILL